MPPPSDVDDELTAAALAAGRGDPGALAQLLRDTHARVWRLAAVLRGTGQATGLTLTAYRTASAGLASYTGQPPVLVWLAQHTLRACARPWWARLDTAPADRTMLAGLPRRDREIFALTQVMQLSYRDTATACATTAQDVAARVAAIRNQMITRLDHSHTSVRFEPALQEKP